MSFLHQLRNLSAIVSALLLLGMLGACKSSKEKSLQTGVGTVQKTTAGDRACYVELIDEKGVKKNLSADFSICEMKLKGKKIRYRLDWANLIAPSCEGAPDCKKTVRELIIVSARAL